MSELYRKKHYTKPEEKCPFCEAPLTAFCAEDGPFKIMGTDDDGEPMELEVYGSERWACGTKRVGFVGTQKTSPLYYKVPREVNRAGDCYENQCKALESEATMKWAEYRKKDERIAELEKEVKSVTDLLERETQYRNVAEERVQRLQADFEKHAKLCAECHNYICEARETPEGIQHFCMQCGRQVAHILRAASGGPVPVEDEDEDS